MTFLTIASALLFGVSANMDNIVVGLSLGMKKIEVGKVTNLLIAFILSIVTILSMVIGKMLNALMPTTMANISGGVLLILIGLYALWKSIHDNKQKEINAVPSQCSMKNYIEILDTPEKADLDKSGTINGKESLLLAAALSINNLGLGIGAGITGLNVFITVLFAFIFSILFLSIGYYLGSNYLSKALGKHASITAALLIILLGLYETIV
ncbi:MAG: sporulation membrane protein YtaF [Syntrophomonadaceae bacterium]|nr:sporulation membrane protein YtaF [Syntrophomonadaceae bacterium]